MTTYVLLNWYLNLLTSLLLIASLLRYRYLIIKPTIIVILFFHVTIQWAATIQSAYIETYLPDPLAFSLLVHGFPLIGLCVTFFTWNSLARSIWQSIRYPLNVLPQVRNRAALMLGACIILFVAYYLYVIPLANTGLYTTFVDPSNAQLAREQSLKLVSDPVVRYGYGFVASALAPLLAVLMTQSLIWNLKHRRVTASAVNATVIGSLLVVVSLTGARSFAATLLLVIFLSILLNKGVPIKPLHIVLAVIAILALPTAFTLLREGQNLTLSGVYEYMFGPIARRVFIDPMKGGLWHTHYAQTVGFFGVAGIPKLAGLFGVQPVDVPNLIGLSYEDYTLETVSSTASYVFSYYSYFGLVSLPISLLGLWLLDFSLWVYKQLSDNLLLACVSTVSVGCVSFVSSDYTTVLLTHGILVSLVGALIVDHLSRKKIRSGLRLARRSLQHTAEISTQPGVVEYNDE